MSTRDYLSRYFHQLAEVLAALMRMRNRGENQLALDEIDQVLNSWFNINAEQINESTVEELFEKINEHPEQVNDKIKVMAELLYQKVITYHAMNRMDDKLFFAVKALNLFHLIDKRSNEYSIEIQERIAELDQMLLKA